MEAAWPRQSKQLEYPRYARISPDGHDSPRPSGLQRKATSGLTSTCRPPVQAEFNAHNIFPTWSPDGASGIHVDARRAGEERVHRAVGRQRRRLETIIVGDKDEVASAGLVRLAGLSGQRRIHSSRSLEGGPTTGWQERGLAADVVRGNHPVFSPDGAWVAYVSDTTGARTIWVRPFPGPRSQFAVAAGDRSRVGARRQGIVLSGRLEDNGRRGPFAPAIQFQTRRYFESGFVVWSQTRRAPLMGPRGRFLMVEPSAAYSQRFKSFSMDGRAKRLVRRSSRSDCSQTCSGGAIEKPLHATSPLRSSCAGKPSRQRSF